MIKNKKSKYLIVFTVLLALVLVLLFFYARSRQNSTDNQPEIIDSTTKTTSDAPTAQEDFSDGDESRMPSGRIESAGSGTVDETSFPQDSTNPSDWKRSTNDEIVLYSPTGGILKNGDKIFGKSNLSSVNFRLIDNVSGVISQGSLPVKDGEFAGSFNFTTTGTKGRLDVFGTDSQGLEFANIEIELEF